MEKRECLNPECKKLFVPKRSDSSVCSTYCQGRVQYLKSKNGGKLPTSSTKRVPSAAKTADGGVSTPAKATKKTNGNGAASAKDLIAYLELLHQVEAFEEDHPDVVELAKPLMEKIAARGA